MRTILPSFAACLLLVPLAAWGQGLNGVTASTSIAEVDTIMTTPVTQRVDTYSTELRARIGNGSFLYDQTFNVPFSDPQVQAAITQAHSVLAGAGAVSFTGPTQISSNTSQVSSTTNTVTTGTSPQVFISTTQYVGPQTIPTANLGICQSYVLNGANIRPTLTGCVPGGTPFIIAPGGVDYDTLTFSLVTISKTATTTNTFLTTAVYELDGFAQGSPPPATPVPPSLVLVLTGLAGAGLYRVRRKFARRG
jgi:hypothetical protein